MVATLLLILWAVLGGLWRRMFGGWLGLPRSVCYGLMAPLALPLALLIPPLWWPYQVLATIAASGLLLAFFVASLWPGARFDNADVFKRYGPFGLGYWLARLYWPERWCDGDCIDGPMAVGEISLGASVFGCVGIAWYWVI